MRQALYMTTAIGICSLLLATGCKKEDETPQPNTAANMQPGYQQQPGGYPQQPAQTPQQGTAPTGAPAGSPTPNALATPCKSDAECIGAKCNLQAQKCQFPCGSNNDCQTGWACMMGACAPSLNTQQPQ